MPPLQIARRQAALRVCYVTPLRVMRRAGCPHPAAAAWGAGPPYRLPYSRCSFITASTSGGSTSGHCSRGIFPLRMSLDAQG